jgi:thiol-disulfide isomerase/thioredoxin
MAHGGLYCRLCRRDHPGEIGMTTRSPSHLARSIATAAAILALACAWDPDVLSAGEFKQAPPIKAPGLDGKIVEVRYADARVTLVNFWAIWCLPCREEMPAINRIFQKYHDRGFKAIGLALQSGEPAEVKDFLDSRKLGLTYPILMSSDDLAASYGDVEIVPTTYLIGSKGEVLKSFFGIASDFERSLGGEVEKILGQPAAPAGAAKRD